MRLAGPSHEPGRRRARTLRCPHRRGWPGDDSYPVDGIGGAAGHAARLRSRRRSRVAVGRRRYGGGRDGPHVARDFFVSQVASAHAAWQPEALAFWDWRCLLLRGAGGEVARLLVTLTDVTARLLQERGRGLNAKILEHMAIGIATTAGEEHIITLANARFARFAGAPAPDLLGRPLGAALPAGSAGRFGDLLDRVYRTGSPFSADEFAFQPAADGATAFWNLVVMPLPGLQDGTGGLMLMAVDITDQARARREMEGLAAAAAQRAGQLEAVIGSMVDGVFLLDARGMVIEANEAGLALLGLPAAVTSQRLSEYLAPLAPRRADGRSLAPDVDLLDGVLAG